MAVTYLGFLVIILIYVGGTKSQESQGPPPRSPNAGNDGYPYPDWMPGGGGGFPGGSARGGGGRGGGMPPWGPGAGGPGGGMIPGSDPGQGIPPGNTGGSASALDHPSYGEEESQQDPDVPPPDWARGNMDGATWPMQPGAYNPNVPFPEDTSFESTFPGPGSGSSVGISQGSQHEPEDHIYDNTGTGRDENDSNGGKQSESPGSFPESGVAVKHKSFTKNSTVAVHSEDDDFNYVGMYITVAICIAFMVTLVAIGLIRGPQGPFKTKRTDDEVDGIMDAIANRGAAGDEVITLDDGTAQRTDDQWEQQPLRSDGETVGVVCESSTTVTVNENQC